jgi:hypothetical protein
MAQLHFRITDIALDEEEDVTALTAVVDRGIFEVITGILPKVTTTDERRGGTEMVITLPIADAQKVWRECGRMTGADPRYAKGTTEIYDSMCMVVYGLMGE